MPLLQNLQRQIRISLMIERKWNESERDYFFLGICFHTLILVFRKSNIPVLLSKMLWLYIRTSQKSLLRHFGDTMSRTLNWPIRAHFFVYINGRHLGKHTDRWNDGGILTTRKLSLKTLGGKWAWEKLSPSMLVEESMCNSLQFFILLLF